MICSGSSCPKRNTSEITGNCTVHAKVCHKGIGLFILVLEGVTLLIYRSRAAYYNSIYVDKYGEEFGERHRNLSNRGRPLYLNTERYNLLQMWYSGHQIPQQVVKIQNNSERVILNSYY